MSYYLFLLFIFIGTILENFKADLNVAVVEYQFVKNENLSIDEQLINNANNYINILESAKSVSQEDLDLVVYPELTLTSSIGQSIYIEIGSNPCEDDPSDFYPQFIKKLSCAAKFNKIFLVVNLIETAKCTNEINGAKSDNCNKYGHFFYNTNVIFNDEGSIIARYRKYNLFGEYSLDQPKMEPTVFQIKNETFGIFTCFDILFKNPALDLVGKNGAKNIIFPTMWFSELPFLTALQTQQMWSFENNVKLFAAGANNPNVGSGGSGIFNGLNDPTIIDIIAQGGSNFYFENNAIEKNKNIDELAREMDNFYFLNDDLNDYSNIILDINKNATQYQICSKNSAICCLFNINLSLNQSLNTSKLFYTYHLLAYSGIRSFSGVYYGGIEICGLVACLNSSLSSCGHKFDNYNEVQWVVTFEKIAILANFTIGDHKIQFPNSLLSSIRPIPNSQTEWNRRVYKEEKKVEREFILVQPQNRLMTFAIFGRNFDLDSENSANGLFYNNLFLIALIQIYFF